MLVDVVAYINPLCNENVYIIYLWLSSTSPGASLTPEARL